MTPDAPLARVEAVSFDAGGTLLEVAEPVGETYARLARAEGFAVTAAALEAGFRRAFVAAPPLAPPPGETRSLADFERAWWRAVVDASLDLALGGARCADRDARERFFAAAFAHYARAAAWRLFPEVRPVLHELARRGLPMAVISNFDRRLHGVLAGLGLGDAFRATVASSEAGAAKPAPGIFAVARRLLGDPPAARLLHVGDSLGEDVHGALAAGWQAAWVDRSGAAGGAVPPGVRRIAGLAELPRLLQSASA